MDALHRGVILHRQRGGLQWSSVTASAVAAPSASRQPKSGVHRHGDSFPHRQRLPPTSRSEDSVHRPVGATSRMLERCEFYWSKTNRQWRPP